MDNVKKVWYRTFQFGLNIGSRALYWRKPKLISGAGCRKDIAELFKAQGISRVVVVTGRHVGRSIAPEIMEGMKKAGIDCVHYSKVEANPSTSTVYEIEKLYRDEGCKGFLAIGGGSPMDAAKAAAALIVRPGKSLNKMAGLFKVLKRLPFFVAIPTTAGTGSETTIAAVITDAETHHKYAIMDLSLIPRYAVMDPELSRDLPPKPTATTGMDALTHAVEVYVGRSMTKASKTAAEKSVKLILENLERLLQTGREVIIRTPVIPAYNDGTQLKLIKKYCSDRGLHHELLPYHAIGESKKRAILK